MRLVSAWVQCNVAFMLKMQVIPIPVWNRPYERTVDPAFGAVEYERVFAQRSLIMGMVQVVVEGYINCKPVTFNSAKDGFPSRDRLTGDYYVSSESYWIKEDTDNFNGRQYCFSIMAHCLEHSQFPEQIDQDYLGLEIHFVWQPSFGWFEFYGDVDSSSI